MADATASRLERILRGTLVCAAACAAVALAVLVALRIGYPFDLEWMEGAMVDEAARVRDGLPTYAAPDVFHVTFLYTPLYYWLGAAVMAVLGEGPAALRCVSVLGTVACLLLVGRAVRRETGDARLAVVAAGLFCAGYGWLRGWFDLARSDLVFAAAVLGTAALLQRGGASRAGAAALLAVVAFLAKQTALFWLPWLALGAVVRDVRAGIVFAATAAASIGLTVLLGDLATDGWFSFHVFAMPRLHALVPDRWVAYWTEDLVPLAPLVLAAGMAVVGRWRAQARREALGLAAFALGGIATSYASRLHLGGYDNVLLYAFAALCCVGPMAACVGGRRQRQLGYALLLLQFAFLVVDVRSLWAPWPPQLYRPAALLPSPEHRQACTELLEFVRAQPGEVWLPFHGHMATLAGKRPTAHGQAVHDLLPWLEQAPASDRALAAMAASAERELGQRRFAAVVLEQPFGRLFEDKFGAFLAGYERRAGELVSVPTALRPLVGMVTDSPYALVPKR